MNISAFVFSWGLSGGSQRRILLPKEEGKRGKKREEEGVQTQSLLTGEGPAPIR